MDSELSSATEASDRSGELSIAEKLNRLFATTHPAGRGPYTLREVAQLISEQEERKPDAGLAGHHPR